MQAHQQSSYSRTGIYRSSHRPAIPNLHRGRLCGAVPLTGVPPLSEGPVWRTTPVTS
jgi:hypothetical protein